MKAENLLHSKFKGKEVVVIIGAGPAGLSAAYELVRSGIQPILFELSVCRYLKLFHFVF